jgi:hypothetical protein
LIFGIHNASAGFVGLGVVAKHSGLLDQGIDQGRLAVVDVRNDSNVAIKSMK